ncbi:protein ADM2 [Xiphias gladius]|uniref:protein ADM2 n=1 Tax=Xiphias gladius TaxID=8245 RepID=UPI001A98BA8C|nr:protein ADM2 [Xiphias gladius]
MCALLPAWLCLLLGFLPLEIQSRALTLQSLTHRHRWSLPRTSKCPKSSHTAVMSTAYDLSVATDNQITQGDRHIIWRALMHKEPPPKLSDPLLLEQSHSVPQEAPLWHRRSRGRRHANSGGGRGHSHLMRVGCVLGTCQVQNLSHRLYQLIGQSGREDSSPINPRSPHSYG